MWFWPQHFRVHSLRTPQGALPPARDGRPRRAPDLHWAGAVGDRGVAHLPERVPTPAEEESSLRTPRTSGTRRAIPPPDTADSFPQPQVDAERSFPERSAGPRALREAGRQVAPAKRPISTSRVFLRYRPCSPVWEWVTTMEDESVDDEVGDEREGTAMGCLLFLRRAIRLNPAPHPEPAPRQECGVTVDGLRRAAALGGCRGAFRRRAGPWLRLFRGDLTSGGE